MAILAIIFVIKGSTDTLSMTFLESSAALAASSLLNSYGLNGSINPYRVRPIPREHDLRCNELHQQYCQPWCLS